MYTTASTAISSNETKDELNASRMSNSSSSSRSTAVDPNDLPLTLFTSHPILQIRKKIRLVETLASRAR